MTGPDKPNDMIRDDEAVSPAELRDLFSMEDDEVLEDRIPTHDGDWVREGESYHFWSHADVERDYVNGACPPVALEHFDRNTGKSELVALHNGGVIPAGTVAPTILERGERRPVFFHPDLAAPYGQGKPVSGREAIRAALKRLDDIETFPEYEQRWPWYVRWTRIWLGVEEEWLEEHERARAAFYAEQKGRSS